MASEKKPKVILCDIGGVVVLSPFQAILDYELSLGIPPGWINYSISKTAPNGNWQKLERGQIPMDAAFYAGFNADLSDSVRWAAFYAEQQAKNPSLPRGPAPPLPPIDGEWLFNEMQGATDFPDPWMFPALQKVRESGEFLLAALSNTAIFPEGHKLYRENFFDHPVRQIFDVFMSSAHMGMRKPDKEIYDYALKRVDAYARENAESEKGRRLGWAEGVKAGEIVFLDDIGENLKAAKKEGLRTIKVNLGRAFEAVDELERVTGMKLAGDHPRIPIKPKMGGTKAKI